MDCILRTCTFALCLTALSTGIAFPQAASDATPAATVTASPVAHVYVGTTGGIYLYDAAPNGGLSPAAGSPYKNTVGLMLGPAGSHFITEGTNYLHSYPLTSRGGIGSQVAQINTALYTGSECGTTHGGTIDRTGTEAYIRLDGSADETCKSLQSFHINGSTGAFTFGGSAYAGGGTQPPTFEGPILLAGNNAHAYTFAQYYCEQEIDSFYRDRFGTMNEAASTITFPPPNGGAYFASAMAFDNQNLRTSHMAMAIHEDFGDCGNDATAPAVASFTVDYNGNLTYNGSMLKTAINPATMAINPQGNLLAVGGPTSNPFYPADGPGLQVFHFNGANPITALSGIVTSAPINEIRWDNNNHLYALSYATHRLYAYTITSSSVTPITGSPYTVGFTPNALFVAPTAALCSAPASAGVHICAPAGGSTVSSPVLVEAASTVSGTIARMELWVDGVKKYTAPSSRQLNTTAGLAAGTHRFAVLAVNTAGQKWQSVANATVK
jgi:Big-like domain-containing protein